VRHFAAHVKFFASSVLPEPEYFATRGYAHAGCCAKAAQSTTAMLLIMSRTSEAELDFYKRHLITSRQIH
jgi:hypothetical protein